MNYQTCLFFWSDLDECEENPCENGGTCSTPQFDMFACDCVEGFTGDRCETSKQYISLKMT